MLIQTEGLYVCLQTNYLCQLKITFKKKKSVLFFLFLLVAKSNFYRLYPFILS